MRFPTALLLIPLLAQASAPGKKPVPPSPGEDHAQHGPLREAVYEYERGMEFADGKRGIQDYTQAAFHYRNAAEKDYARAQYSLAHLYEHGLGVNEDLEQAGRWYRKAAEQGDPYSQNSLGNLYATGRGVPNDDGEAAKWYLLAAEQGNLAAQSNLANFYLNGRGVPRDLEKAIQLCSKAAHRGYAIAQHNLALMYANGQGVAQDLAWAHAWMDLASEELESSAAIRDRMAKVMTVEQLATAQELSKAIRLEIAAVQK
ncbi:MAG: tetratricopeptide repeat protein [Acidobacteriota bacterium]